jgi:hypothetical protein
VWISQADRRTIETGVFTCDSSDDPLRFTNLPVHRFVQTKIGCETMPEIVTSDTVPAGNDVLYNLRILMCFFRDEKKGCFEVVFLKHVEYLWGEFRIRTIIECQRAHRSFFVIMTMCPAEKTVLNVKYTADQYWYVKQGDSKNYQMQYREKDKE